MSTRTETEQKFIKAINDGTRLQEGPVYFFTGFNQLCRSTEINRSLVYRYIGPYSQAVEIATGLSVVYSGLVAVNDENPQAQGNGQSNRAESLAFQVSTLGPEERQRCIDLIGGLGVLDQA